MTCPVPPEEDCPVRWLAGDQFVFILIPLSFIAVLLVGNWLFSGPDVEKPPLVQPAEKPAAHPFGDELPLYGQHWWSCPQCRAPLINDKGEESGGMCEEGFRLFQEDMRRKVK
jgi:hypothetical protein